MSKVTTTTTIKKSTKKIATELSKENGKTVIKNASELSMFIGKALPWMRDTGKAKHLRKIEDFPKSKGKAVIIWYGCPTSNDITKLQVTVNLKVHAYGFVSDPQIITDTENELKIALACMDQERKQVKARIAKKVQKARIEIPAEPVAVEAVAEVQA
jgi:ribosomal protein S8